MVNYAALPETSPYRYTAQAVAVEYAATKVPRACAVSSRTCAATSSIRSSERPTYLSDGNEFYDNTEDYRNASTPRSP